MYIGPNSRTERPRKTKIGTEVAHVTRDSDTTFKVKRSKVNLQGHIVAASRTACSILNAIVFLFHFTQNVDVCTKYIWPAKLAKNDSYVLTQLKCSSGDNTGV